MSASGSFTVRAASAVAQARRRQGFARNEPYDCLARATAQTLQLSLEGTDSFIQSRIDNISIPANSVNNCNSGKEKKRILCRSLTLLVAPVCFRLSIISYLTTMQLSSN
jgi:hypothetical protein